ncbi:S-layer homology domain-containing protein [Serinibacter arcticus]|uniref:Glycerol-3-phosphate ABC transporter, periplasmic glycerol-3-phosphate-binding protein n=1 Tax=Serinibacter arcticus TaxID=1655435 RepID=A0A4Z1E2K2_9MICO|nr:S-layer homology domain-containing protein [Serinibacter arcticus]TGO06254.1 Glycerol-3-phosphate ABC transporter, periplasmic glycerol-3-phosphate-binding protein [Serinibacter arcticus]
MSPTGRPRATSLTARARRGTTAALAALACAALVVVSAPAPSSAEAVGSTTRLTVVLDGPAADLLLLQVTPVGPAGGPTRHGMVIHRDRQSHAITQLSPGPHTVALNQDRRTNLYPSGWLDDAGRWVSNESGTAPVVTIGSSWRELGPVSMPLGGTITGRLVDSAGADVTLLGASATPAGASAERTGSGDGSARLLVPGLSSTTYGLRVETFLGEHVLIDTPAGPALATEGALMPVSARLGTTTALGAIVVPDVFTDVLASNQFAREIAWVKDRGVATGFPDGRFAPLQSVNRDAMAAFLYRLAGEPPFTAPEASPFADVPVGTQFYKEITWLADSGISTGWLDGTFRPLEPVGRDAMAAFLYRYVDAFGRWADTPRSSTTRFVTPVASRFPDVSTTSPFHREISWMAAEYLTNGFGDGTFRPLQPVNRDAMAAFLMRVWGR